MHPVLPCLLLSLSSGVAAPVATPTPATPSAVSEQPKAPQPALTDPEAWQRRWSRMGLAEALAETADICQRVPIGDIPAWLRVFKYGIQNELLTERLLPILPKAEPQPDPDAESDIFNEPPEPQAHRAPTPDGRFYDTYPIDRKAVAAIHACIEAHACAKDPASTTALLERWIHENASHLNNALTILARSQPTIFLESLERLHPGEGDTTPDWNRLAQKAFRALALNHPAKAFARCNQIEDEEDREHAREQVLDIWLHLDFRAAAEAARSCGMELDLERSRYITFNLYRRPAQLLAGLDAPGLYHRRPQAIAIWLLADPDAARNWLREHAWELSTESSREIVEYASYGNIGILIETASNLKTRESYLWELVWGDWSCNRTSWIWDDPEPAQTLIFAQPEPLRRQLLDRALFPISVGFPTHFCQLLKIHPELRSDPDITGWIGAVPFERITEECGPKAALDLLAEFYDPLRPLSQEDSENLHDALMDILDQAPRETAAIVKGLSGPMRNSAEAALIAAEARRDIDCAIGLLRALPQDAQSEAAGAMVRTLYKRNGGPAQAKGPDPDALLARLPEGPAREGALDAFANPELDLDGFAARERLFARAASLTRPALQLPTSPDLANSTKERIKEHLAADPAATLRRFADIKDPAIRNACVQILGEFIPAVFDKSTRTQICDCLSRLDIPAAMRSRLLFSFDPKPRAPIPAASDRTTFRASTPCVLPAIPAPKLRGQAPLPPLPDDASGVALQAEANRLASLPASQRIPALLETARTLPLECVATLDPDIDDETYRLLFILLLDRFALQQPDRFVAFINVTSWDGHNALPCGALASPNHFNTLFPIVYRMLHTELLEHFACTHPRESLDFLRPHIGVNRSSWRADFVSHLSMEIFRNLACTLGPAKTIAIADTLPQGPEAEAARWEIIATCMEKDAKATAEWVAANRPDDADLNKAVQNYLRRQSGLRDSTQQLQEPAPTPAPAEAPKPTPTDWASGLCLPKGKHRLNFFSDAGKNLFDSMAPDTGSWLAKVREYPDLAWGIDRSFRSKGSIDHDILRAIFASLPSDRRQDIFDFVPESGWDSIIPRLIAPYRHDSDKGKLSITEADLPWISSLEDKLDQWAWTGLLKSLGSANIGNPPDSEEAPSRAEIDAALASIPYPGLRPFAAITFACDSANEGRYTEAIAIIQAYPSESGLAEVLAAIANHLSESDIDAATAWAATLPKGYARDCVTEILIPRMIHLSPAAAQTWLDNISDPALRTELESYAPMTKTPASGE